MPTPNQLNKRLKAIKDNWDAHPAVTSMDGQLRVLQIEVLIEAVRTLRRIDNNTKRKKKKDD